MSSNFSRLHARNLKNTKFHGEHLTRAITQATVYADAMQCRAKARDRKDRAKSIFCRLQTVGEPLL